MTPLRLLAIYRGCPHNIQPGNYGDGLLNPPISIAFGRPGCCRRGGRSRPATKSFEPRGRPAGAELKASFAENPFREEFWVADPTLAHGWILRLNSRTLCDLVSRGANSASPNNATAVTPEPLNKFLAKVAKSFYICSCAAVPAEIAEPIVDLLNRGVSVAGIAAREGLTAKRSRPEMAPQRLEKIESAPGNGMVSEASNPQDVVHRRAADRAQLQLSAVAGQCRSAVFVCRFQNADIFISENRNRCYTLFTREAENPSVKLYENCR